MTHWIAAQFRRAIDQTIAGNGDWCVTLQSKANPDHWVQLTWEAINLVYPSEDDPSELVASLPEVPFLDITSWEPNQFLTLSHGADESLPAIADLVAEYIERLLGESTSETQWTVTEEAL